jgi:hypothetical protein
VTLSGENRAKSPGVSGSGECEGTGASFAESTGCSGRGIEKGRNEVRSVDIRGFGRVFSPLPSMSLAIDLKPVSISLNQLPMVLTLKPKYRSILALYRSLLSEVALQTYVHPYADFAAPLASASVHSSCPLTAAAFLS